MQIKAITSVAAAVLLTTSGLAFAQLGGGGSGSGGASSSSRGGSGGLSGRGSTAPRSSNIGSSSDMSGTGGLDYGRTTGTGGLSAGRTTGTGGLTGYQTQRNDDLGNQLSPSTIPESSVPSTSQQRLLQPFTPAQGTARIVRGPRSGIETGTELDTGPTGFSRSAPLSAPVPNQ